MWFIIAGHFENKIMQYSKIPLIWCPQ